MQLDSIADQAETLYTDNVAPLTTLSTLQRDFQAWRGRVLEYGGASAETRAKLLTEIDERIAKINDDADTYQPTRSTRTRCRRSARTSPSSWTSRTTR